MKQEYVIKKKSIIITMIVTALVLVAVIVGGSIGVAYMVYNAVYIGAGSTEFFNSEMAFEMDSDVAFTVEKEKDEDFVILNLSDPQIGTWQDTVFDRNRLRDDMAKAIEQAKPDLITVTGDMIWCDSTYKSMKDFIKMMDEFDIPWAPVMGNHESDGNTDLNWIADQLIASEHCLYSKGPSNINGVGNYLINVEQAGEVVHTLVMLDSGAGMSFDDSTINEGDSGFEFHTNEDGDRIVSGYNYDYIRDNQLEWYEWAMQGIAANQGKVITQVESSAYFHIPLPEFNTAYKAWEESGFSDVGEFAGNMGENNENVYCSKFNNGVFDILKNNNTKTITVGHDHSNNSSLMYKGVRLTYGMKIGDRSYSEEGLNGGTLLTIDNDGVMNTVHNFI